MIPESSSLLAMNAGSSSIKFAFFKRVTPARSDEMFRGSIYKIGLTQSRFQMKAAGGSADFDTSISAPNFASACRVLLAWLVDHLKGIKLEAIGHRIVQGGPSSISPCLVDSRIRKQLQAVVRFDPLHLPQEILLLDELAKVFPGVPQYACFDTSFHEALPRVARLLPLPLRYFEKGVRRYGFHGLSYESLAGQLLHLSPGKIKNRRAIFAHLGSGSSLAAVQEGQSIDTTMSFTPASGVPMGTRSGDIDPGLIHFLSQSEGLAIDKIDHLLQSESGLLGMSETTSDMQQLLRIEDSDSRAADAIGVYCYNIKKSIGAFAAAMSGLDTLIFAGGIGENAPSIRARICANLSFLGIEIDEKRNSVSGQLISKTSSRVAVWVLRTDEEKMIADKIFVHLERKRNGNI